MTPAQYEELMALLRMIETDIHRLIRLLLDKGKVNTDHWLEDHPDGTG